MKKIIVVILFLSLILLTGCSNNDLTIDNTTTFTNVDASNDSESINPYADKKMNFFLREKETKYYLYGENVDINNYEIVVYVDNKEEKTVPLSSNLISYEIIKNNNQYFLSANYYGKNAGLGLNIGSNPYEWYDSRLKYYISGQQSNELIVLLSNEESLLNKEYNDSDFDFIVFDSFEELTISRHKEIALETNDANFKRLFIFKVGKDNLSNIDSFIEQGKNVSWIEEMYYCPYSFNKR